VSVEEMLVRLVSRGLLPCEHNLQIWQHADGSGFGAGVSGYKEEHAIEAHGETFQLALENLMIATNRGADIAERKPNV